VTADEVTYCARHPQVETGLLCGRCSTPICPRCLVQTPVGARCPDCARVSRVPTVDVQPVYVLRGIGGALAGGLAVGAFWGYALGEMGRTGLLFMFVIAIGIGWAVSEAVSLATNRRRGVALAACAVVGVGLAYIVHNLVAGEAPLPRDDSLGYLVAIGASVFAVSRLRP
jgi:hypothetical protein